MSLEKINILAVDDRSDGLIAIEAVLSSPEYNLVLAGSGHEALGLMSQHDFALVLLDVQMPVMDGFETAQKIKQDDEWKDVPIIFLTAISKEITHIYKGYECGAVDYLFKPFDPWVLKSKVSVFVDLYRKKRHIQEQTKLLEESRQRVQQRTVELSLANRALQIEMAERLKVQKEILEIRDQEQKRIGQDLHDGLAQQLAGIAFVSKVLQQKLQPDKEEAKIAEDIMDLIKKAIYETKRIARGFYPIELEKHGLFPALEELCVNTQKQFFVNCECSFNEAMQITDLNLATHIYRISQEAVHNAIKHGKAKKIKIAAERINDQIIFTIRDDGSGFQPGENDGMGIRTMNYRAKMIGATLTIEKQESGGTLVTCKLENELISCLVKSTA